MRVLCVIIARYDLIVNIVYDLELIKVEGLKM